MRVETGLSLALALKSECVGKIHYLKKEVRVKGSNSFHICLLTWCECHKYICSIHCRIVMDTCTESEFLTVLAKSEWTNNKLTDIAS